VGRAGQGRASSFLFLVAVLKTFASFLFLVTGQGRAGRPGQARASSFLFLVAVLKTFAT
jgi:hypothetical protein